MKSIASAILVAAALVAGSFYAASAQSPGPAYATYAVDTFAFAGDYTMGREVESVFAGTICGEPFTKGKPGKQLVSLQKVLEARGAQGYHMVAYHEGGAIETPVDGHYTNEGWRSNVRIVWAK